MWSSGKVFDPAGANPLYNVIVFIPNDVATLPAITPGTSSCNACNVSIGDYVAATVTDATGSFTLTNVPTGMGVPVTVQIGKWRRTTTVNIPSCATTTVPDGTLRLPGKKSEGDMPQMALLTGGCDDIGCFLTNMGIDPSEFTGPQGGGRVDVYQGLGNGSNGASLSNGTAGDCTNASCPLWASKQSFEYYDMAILSCECAEQTNTNESAAAYTNLRDWLNEGGRVLASHYQDTWFKDNPSADLQGVATWLDGSTALDGGTDSGTYDLSTTFELGMQFDRWLGNLGGLADSGPPPAMNLASVGTSVSTVNPPTTQWIYDPSTSPNDTKYLSFETPLGGMLDADAEASPFYCGKAAFTDLHTTDSPVSTVSSIPSGCTPAALTPQQKALEFLFFDLSGCYVSPAQPQKGLPPL
jgi:hypothetical protein